MMRSSRIRWTLLAGGVLLLSGALAPGMLAAAPGVRQAADEKPNKEKEEAQPLPPGIRLATEAERKAVTTAIEAQLKAFRDNDYEKAQKYQSAELKRGTTLEMFRRMMREVYPQFANYKSVTFGEARCDTKGEVVQIRVTLTGQDRVTVKAVYMMEKEDGEYRVSGVFGGMPAKFSPKDTV